MTTPPTDEQRHVAFETMVAWGVDAPNLSLLVDRIAQALADQAAAIHARYDVLATQLLVAAQSYSLTSDDFKVRVLVASAIREVSR